MNEIEQELLTFIMSKDIDFLNDSINLDISFDSHSFSLISSIISEDLLSYYIAIDMKLLRNEYEFIKLSDEFKENVAKYFEFRITVEEEYLMYRIQLNNCLREMNITYTT